MDIPANATMAVMFGALMLQGITPGPLVVEEHPYLLWGVVNSMYMGDLLLLAISLPLTILVTMNGVCSVRMNVFDMSLVIGLWGARLSDEEDRVRAGAAGARVRAGQHPRVVVPPLIRFVSAQRTRTPV
ncbi:MAG: tripartite tricarboxylate transporter permease [Nocardioidaceae bacterium]